MHAYHQHPCGAQGTTLCNVLSFRLYVGSKGPTEVALPTSQPMACGTHTPRLITLQLSSLGNAGWDAAQESTVLRVRCLALTLALTRRKRKPPRPASCS